MKCQWLSAVWNTHMCKNIYVYVCVFLGVYSICRHIPSVCVYGSFLIYLNLACFLTVKMCLPRAGFGCVFILFWRFSDRVLKWTSNCFCWNVGFSFTASTGTAVWKAWPIVQPPVVGINNFFPACVTGHCVFADLGHCWTIVFWFFIFGADSLMTAGIMLLMYLQVNQKYNLKKTLPRPWPTNSPC